MKQIEFASTGVQVSALCLGTMNFVSRCDYQASQAITWRAIELGINFIDTAPMYANGGAEEYLGKILKGRRQEVFLATKVVKGLDRHSIRESLEESLARLQTDYVDLFMIHWPQPGMDVCEVMETLNALVASGKTRYVGCCNYPAWLLAHSNAIAMRRGWQPLVCNQVAYNLIERGVEIEILPQAAAEKIAINPYRVLSMGLLAGKFSSTSPMPASSRGASDSRVITWLAQHGSSIDRFNQYAAGQKIHPGDLALAWVRYSKAVTSPVLGFSSVQQLEEMAPAFDLELSPEEYTHISAMFSTEVFEEGLQLFPGAKYNFPRLRRRLDLIKET